MAVARTWAFDTPFSWTKQIASHWGGVRQGMAISWPKVIKDKGAIRNQFMLTPSMGFCGMPSHGSAHLAMGRKL
jgi:arylsulfatase A-like enzyme